MPLVTKNPELIQPHIEVLGIRINEPVVMLTDIMISIVCITAYFKLKKLPANNKTLLYIRGYFLLMAIATFYGGIVGNHIPQN